MTQRGFDPMADMSHADKQHLNQVEQAKTRQSAAWEGKRIPMSPEDEERKRLSDAHRAKTMANAGMTPAEISKKLAEQGIPVPPVDAAEAERRGSVQAGVQAGVPSKFSVLRAHAEVTEHEIPQAGEQYAPDWKSLKEVIKKHDGTWIVEQFEFHPDTGSILGFFGKDGWPYPENALKGSFEAIVKSGRVFRTDPE